jgi:ATP-binding cassette, subfamily A (ABC1), member 3
LCTSFFKKANSGAAGTGVLFFLTYLPFIFISLRYEALNFSAKIFTCFINNLAMSNGLYLLAAFEGKNIKYFYLTLRIKRVIFASNLGKGTGIQFDNWTKGETIDDPFSFFDTIIIMFFNNFIHLILMYYFENIMPGNHGIAKPWYFPISFLLPKRFSAVESEIKLKNLSSSSEIDQDKNVFIEDEANYKNKNVGIRINNLSKKFKQLGKVKKAVNNLSLNIYEEQISVLLGHNGAGKSKLYVFFNYKQYRTIYIYIYDNYDYIYRYNYIDDNRPGITDKWQHFN